MEQLYPPSEVFLQYVWKWQFFSHKHLQTTDNKPITIINPGKWNRDQGPDFLDACLEISGIKMYGHVEIHLHSQDWYRHQHEQDPFYNGTILHVVFASQGAKVLRMDGTSIPEVVLEGKINVTLWQKYDRLRLSEERIACHYFIRDVSNGLKNKYLQQLGEERIRLKTVDLRSKLKKNRQNWHQTLWHGIARYLGGKVNGEAFEALAERITPAWLFAYQEKSHLLEALLYGLAGLLSAPSTDAYHTSLREEWMFLRRKHRIAQPIPIQLKYLRMHPASFPTLRISQLADLVHNYPRLEELMKPDSWEDFIKKEIKANSYWQNHNRFGEEKEKSHPRRLGRSMKESLLINVLAPMASLYLTEHGRSQAWEQIRTQLGKLSPENNRITRKWASMSFPNDSALHSQGILHLSKNYCLEKRCLECVIGQKIIRP